MSDRIDELVAAIDANTLLQWDGKDVALVAAHELATIAREAEAEADKWRKVAEWLALHTSHEQWNGGVHTITYPAVFTSHADARMVAAIAATEQEEAE
jgi:hypothetical protein